MYDSLVEWDKDLLVQPALAESWETPDDKTWIFHLRQGVTFHNGDPVTAEDVKYSSIYKRRRQSLVFPIASIRPSRASR